LIFERVGAKSKTRRKRREEKKNISGI